MSAKRKRDSFYRQVAPGAVVVAAPRKRRRKSPFVPGRDRVGGYYGRFSGANAELKFHDIDVNDAVVAAGAVVQNTGSINLIAQGVTESERIGRKCTIRSINWKYRLILPELNNVATPGPSEEVRVILYLDKQANGATMAATGLDLLETADIHSFRNLANSGRFQVLYDKLHVLNFQGPGGDSGGNFDLAEVVREYNFYKKCSFPLEFSGTTGAITEIRSNNLGVMTVGVSGVAKMDGQFRLRFSDQG